MVIIKTEGHDMIHWPFEIKTLTVKKKEGTDFSICEYRTRLYIQLYIYI